MTTTRARSADGRIERESITAEDSEDETPPARLPNTIGDPGTESPTAMANLRRVWNQILWTKLSCTPFITVMDLNDCEQLQPGVLSYVILWLDVSLPEWMQPGTAPAFFLRPEKLHTTLLRWAPSRVWTQGQCRKLQALGQAIISHHFLSQWEVRPPPWPRSYNFGYSPAKERALTAIRDLMRAAIWDSDPGATFRQDREWHVSWA